MADAPMSLPLGMDHGVSIIQPPAQFRAPGDQAQTGIVGQIRIVLLRIDDGIEVPRRRYLPGWGQVRVHRSPARQQPERTGHWLVAPIEPSGGQLVIAHQDQPGRSLQPDNARLLGHDQALLNGYGNGPDGTMPAHGQAAAGFNKQDRRIIGRIMGG